MNDGFLLDEGQLWLSSVMMWERVNISLSQLPVNLW